MVEVITISSSSDASDDVIDISTSSDEALFDEAPSGASTDASGDERPAASSRQERSTGHAISTPQSTNHRAHATLIPRPVTTRFSDRLRLSSSWADGYRNHMQSARPHIPGRSARAKPPTESMPPAPSDQRTSNLVATSSAGDRNAKLAIAESSNSSHPKFTNLHDQRRKGNFQIGDEAGSYQRKRPQDDENGFDTQSQPRKIPRLGGRDDYHEMQARRRILGGEDVLYEVQKLRTRGHKSSNPHSTDSLTDENDASTSPPSQDNQSSDRDGFRPTENMENHASSLRSLENAESRELSSSREGHNSGGLRSPSCASRDRSASSRPTRVTERLSSPLQNGVLTPRLDVQAGRPARRRLTALEAFLHGPARPIKFTEQASSYSSQRQTPQLQQDSKDGSPGFTMRSSLEAQFLRKSESCESRESSVIDSPEGNAARVDSGASLAQQGESNERQRSVDEDAGSVSVTSSNIDERIYHEISDVWETHGATSLERSTRGGLTTSRNTASYVISNGSPGTQMENLRGSPENKSSNFLQPSYAPVKNNNAMVRNQNQRPRTEISSGLAGIGDVGEDVVQATDLIPHSESTSAGMDLPLAEQVEFELETHLKKFRKENEYRTKHSLEHAQSSNEHLEKFESSDMIQEQKTSFADLQPEMHAAISTTPPSHLFEVESISASGKPRSKSKFSLPFTTFATRIADLPDNTHYVSVNDTFMGPNTKTLHSLPYLNDEHEGHDPAELNARFNLDIMCRERKILQLIKAQQYEKHIDLVLKKLQCSWADVLRFLLEPAPDVGSNEDAQRALQTRDKYCAEDFTRTEQRWIQVLSSLPVSTSDKLARAALLCDCFQKMSDFSLWHIARRSDLCKLPENLDEDNRMKLDNELMCAVCLRFNCSCHGELRERETTPEREEGEEEIDTLQEGTEERDKSAEEIITGAEEENEAMEEELAEVKEAYHVVATDLIHPPGTNYRIRVIFPPPALEKPTYRVAELNHEKRSLSYWQSERFKNQYDRRLFYPCNHPGQSCDLAGSNCSCTMNKIACEKTCCCPPDCSRKFQGCGCSAKKSKNGQKAPCLRDGRCICSQLARECDPDLCENCAVDEVLEPVNRYNEDILHGKCRNAGIQRGVPKHTLVGSSRIHGLGLYTCEEIAPLEFVAEYKGELITEEESERRAAFYGSDHPTYLFSLTSLQLPPLQLPPLQVVDSKNFGNKTRFINHAPSQKSNVFPVVSRVNTAHRIAFYASSHIRPGDELCFDYGPQFPKHKLANQPSNIRLSKKTAIPRDQVSISEFDPEDTDRAKAQMRDGSDSYEPEDPDDDDDDYNDDVSSEFTQHDLGDHLSRRDAVQRKKSLHALTRKATRRKGKQPAK